MYSSNIKIKNYGVNVMGHTNIKSFVTGLALAAPLTVMAEQDSGASVINPEVYDTPEAQANLIVSYEEECSQRSTLIERCLYSQRVDLNAHNSIFHFSSEFRNSTQMENLFSNDSDIKKVVVGLHGETTVLNIGLFDIEHPIQTYFDSDLKTAPISLDKSLRDQAIESQVGIQASKLFRFNDRWSLSATVMASKTNEHFINSSHLDSNIYGQANMVKLLRANEISEQDVRTLANDFEAYNRIGDGYRYQGNVPDIGTVDEDTDPSVLRDPLDQLGQHLADEARNFVGQNVNGYAANLSKEGQNFAELVGWIYLRSQGRRDEIINSVDYNQVADRLNQGVQRAIEEGQSVSVPDDFSNRITGHELFSQLSDYLSAQDVERFEARLREELAALQGGAYEDVKISGAQLKALARETLEKLYQDLDDKIKGDPSLYHTLIDNNVEHLKDAHNLYQNKMTYYANTELRYTSDNHDWRFGVQAHRRESDFLATEERYGMYSIYHWNMTEKTDYTNITSIDYYINRYGIKDGENDYEDANILMYHRLQHRFNDHVSVYMAAGATATILDGAHLTAEFGANACDDILGGELCVYGAYEENKTIDGYEQRYLDVDPLDGHGMKAGITYEYEF